MHLNHRVSLALLGCALACACAAPIVRVGQPDLRPSPPVIEQLVDLGGLPLPDTGSISREESDGVLTPGEWVAVLGQGLDEGNKSLVTVDGAAVEIKGHLQGGSLLVQVPRRLAPRQMHQLAVSTPLGKAAFSFNVKSYVIAADTDGKVLHFLPMEPGAKTALSKSAEDIELKQAYLHTLSPGGAWLYLVQATGALGSEQAVQSEVAVVHMGAHKHPRLSGSFSVQTAASPTAVAMLDENTLLVLSEKDLIVCDVRGGSGRQIGRLDLPTTSGKSAYIDVEALAHGVALVLEAYGNAVTLIDLSDLRQPRVTTKLDVGADKGVPWSIDLVPDPDDNSSVWLLQGPNLRISGNKVSRYAATLAEKTKDALGMKSAESGSVKGEKTTPDKPLQESYSRLVHIRAGAAGLMIAGERTLPSDLFPFFLLAQPNGELLVSGVSSNVFQFAGLPRSIDGVKTAVDILTNSLQFGRIVRIRADGSAEPVVKGPALYFNLDALSDGTLVYSVIRPGFSVLPPSLEVEWGVESVGKSDADQAYRRLVELEWTAIIPPYTLGMLSVQ